MPIKLKNREDKYLIEELLKAVKLVNQLERELIKRGMKISIGYKPTIEGLTIYQIAKTRVLYKI